MAREEGGTACSVNEKEIQEVVVICQAEKDQEIRPTRDF
jgi:hypothetical protein